MNHEYEYEHDDARQVARAYLDVLPAEPPTAIDVESVLASARTQRRHRVTVLASSVVLVVAVAALATALAVTASRSSTGVTAEPGNSNGIRSPSAPAGITSDYLTRSRWRITDLKVGSRQPETASAPVVFRFGPPVRPRDDSYLILHEGSCVTMAVQVSNTAVQFQSKMTDNLLLSCGPALSTAQQRRLVQFFTGSVQWTLAGDTLTLSNGYGDAATFIRTT